MAHCRIYSRAREPERVRSAPRRERYWDSSGAALIAPEAVIVDEQPVLSRHSALPLRVSFSWTLMGMLTYAVCQWGMLVAIVRLGSQKMAGEFALGLAIASALFQLAANLAVTLRALHRIRASAASREPS